MSGTQMPAQHGHSVACCNIPPIVTEGYEPKGKYETIGDMNTYVTGSATTSTAILFVFDIFGYFPQTIQGADILATSDHDHQYQVFMPDFFDGQPLDISVYPPTDADKQKKLGAFFGGIGAPPKAVGRIPKIIEEIKKYNPNIKTFGAVGLCWGGKVIALTSQTSSPYKAAAQCHPAMVDPSEAPKISIPFCLLASKDESAEDIQKFDASLQQPKHVETYSDQIHGWMGARADLKVQRDQDEYERGYKTLLEFFAKHLTTAATKANI